jgi:hypothetical protein
MSKGGIVNAVLGGWRVSGIQSYLSGFPIALSRNNPLPIFNGGTRPVITSYDNWRAPLKGDSFDPARRQISEPERVSGAADRVRERDAFQP